jgi:hypothetical protein
LTVTLLSLHGFFVSKKKVGKLIKKRDNYRCCVVRAVTQFTLIGNEDRCHTRICNLELSLYFIPLLVRKTIIQSKTWSNRLMKKTTFAGIVSICMVPALFWSTEGSAIPSWARKYQASCYMCHSGMPQRNAVGEAFKNNGYRLPGGGDDAFTKQENVKIGNDSWNKKFPNAPITGSFPQFDPLSVVLTGNLVNYKESTHNVTTGAIKAGKEFTINAPNTASLFIGATVGDNLTIFGELAGFGGAAVEEDQDATTSQSVDSPVTSNVRAVWQFSPGFNLALGNSFSAVNWNGTGVGGVANVSSVLPAPVTYAELNFTRGETGGYSIVAGTSMGANYRTPIVATKNAIDDILYLRGKVKLFGAGLLSGANGTFGNSYNGLDNQLTIGAGLSYAKRNNYSASSPTASPKGFSGNYIGETLVYGADVQYVCSDLLLGVAASKDRDLGLTNFRAEAGYFVYPWLFAKIGYADIANAANYASASKRADTHQPTIPVTVAAWITPSVSLAGTYTAFQKSYVKNTNVTNQDTFALAVRAGF